MDSTESIEVPSSVDNMKLDHATGKRGFTFLTSIGRSPNLSKPVGVPFFPPLNMREIAARAGAK